MCNKISTGIIVSQLCPDLSIVPLLWAWGRCWWYGWRGMAGSVQCQPALCLAPPPAQRGECQCGSVRESRDTASWQHKLSTPASHVTRDPGMSQRGCVTVNVTLDTCDSPRGTGKQWQVRQGLTQYYHWLPLIATDCHPLLVLISEHSAVHEDFFFQQWNRIE